MRAKYDRATIDAILDAATVAHLAFIDDAGQPYAIPTLHARVGDEVWVHGSAASRMLRNLCDGRPACLTVTLLDGLVLARSIFNHSVNYRSVVALGQMRMVEDPHEKARVLEAFVERLLPGRWSEARSPTDQELKGTTILALRLDEASAKVREGPPGDDEADRALDVWAGEIPLERRYGEPVAAPDLKAAIPLPRRLSR